ncbi:hypothetical protein HpBGD38_14570 [Helicobacter pylori]|uniref:hypothetical protein n=1 Tax=Helicobacter pylori TaxID=210 RepID=UPI0036F25C7C
MNTDRQDYNQYNLLTPLAYGGVVEYNKSNQKKQNAQIRQLVRELNIAPSKDKLQQTYTLILASIILQNTSILKDIYTRYMNTQYKQSNPTLTKYEMDLIANKLYEVYQIRKDYTNERLKDMVKKDYNTQLALLGGLMVGSRNAIVNIKDSVKKLQVNADNMLDDSIHRLRADLNTTTAREYGAFGYIWKNQQDLRVVGNPHGIYPIAKDPITHGNHWNRQDKLYLYQDAPSKIKQELKKRGIKFELDSDLLDGSPGEPYNCRCYRINIFNIDKIK